MSKIEQVLQSGNSHATVNRDPNVPRGEYGALDLKLSASGSEDREFIGTGLHPRAEQLFSGAWSACYISAFEIAASMKKVTLPSDYSVDIQVSIGSVGALPWRPVHHPRAGSGQGSRRVTRAPGPSALPVLEGCARQHRGRPERRHGVKASSLIIYRIRLHRTRFTYT
jgi:organic hydroperoxide reductase OsmC/OhrA